MSVSAITADLDAAIRTLEIAANRLEILALSAAGASGVVAEVHAAALDARTSGQESLDRLRDVRTKAHAHLYRAPVAPR